MISVLLQRVEFHTQSIGSFANLCIQHLQLDALGGEEMTPGGGGRGLGGPMAKHWDPTGTLSSATRPPRAGEAGREGEGEGNLGWGVKRQPTAIDR